MNLSGINHLYYFHSHLKSCGRFFLCRPSVS